MISNKSNSRWVTQQPSDELADRLIERLGVRGAVRACRENLWYGVEQRIKQRHAINSFS